MQLLSLTISSLVILNEPKNNAVLDFTKKFEEHYTNHIDFLFHKLMDLVKKRKYYFKSEKLDDGLYVANED